ncbi:MAG: phosphoribosylanthranilate isomerase [Rhizobiaceae bacterium]|nr:phosphoribosylanthranilate isomerase [Rhizobiaceae bacterium]
MDISVKICGLKTDRALEAALSGGAAYVGFIFFPKSPRHITLEDASRLCALARGRAQSVAVSVNADDSMLESIVTKVQPDILQLHGSESPERLAAIKRRFGLPVIKALAIRDRADLALVDPYRGIADRFLFDAKPPVGSDLPGGNGVSFDWTVLSGLDSDIDYMLSGGLNAGNIATALNQTKANNIDVSSGVESAPGSKDISLIAEFFEAVAAARQRLSA